MTIRSRVIGFFAVPLLLVYIPPFALAADRTKLETGTLVCGSSALTAQITHISVPDQVESEILEQTLILKNTKTNQEKKLKTDSKYIIKHIPEKRKVLDSEIDGWTCIKSKQNKPYFYLGYTCTPSKKGGFCAQGTGEWTRILQEDGTAIIKGPRRMRDSRKDDAIYRSLGLYEVTREVQLKGIGE